MVLFSNVPNIPEDCNFLWCVGTWEIGEIFQTFNLYNRIYNVTQKLCMHSKQVIPTCIERLNFG